MPRAPNLDRLAAEGMRFTDYYAEASCIRPGQLHHR
jgi:arylsulfatase A-like enzyme